jgi:hypothetical protein
LASNTSSRTLLMLIAPQIFDVFRKGPDPDFLPRCTGENRVCAFP